jgi:hypothetical protein
MGKPGQPPTSMSRPGAIGPVGGQGRPGMGGGMMPGATNSGMLSQPRQLPNYNRLFFIETGKLRVVMGRLTCEVGLWEPVLKGKDQYGLRLCT